ncbi:hypothetical protein K431DRAFT_304840 [Polychaeton citri CBS 116435]|uniref:Uncharacterized protein n=1 Tax=Polychaeton citri CBS 116435 TaxID=1314669 RepID=A0A9P4UL81_9PEZI|nr:hypothetical protein K431DRAFT_304840 [Polychaeton citri CBS 116435]
MLDEPDGSDDRVPHVGAHAASCLESPLDHKPSEEERARTLELARYFSSALVVPVGSRGTISTSFLDLQRPSPDNGLTALAQLGVFKLDCGRAIISLIDRSHQYKISEATKTTSLLPNSPHAPSDGLFLGFRALELSFGVCSQTVQVFTSDEKRIDAPNIVADRSRCVIRDFCADPNFSIGPYVWFRYKFLCVVNNKLRAFDNQEIVDLAQVAFSIMSHIELLKTRLESSRAEKLVRGLGSFVAGYSGLQEQQTRSSAESDIGEAPNHS